MSARIAGLSTHIGPFRNSHGVLVDPERDEIAMAIKVAVEVTAHCSVQRSRYDAILFATSGIRAVFPSGAAAVAQSLGLTCQAFDIGAGCASMGTAVQLGASTFATALIVCADVLSRTVDPTDPSHAPLRLFSDGAAAMVIRHDCGPGPTIIACRGQTRGEWRSFYSSCGNQLVRSLPPELKKELRAAYLQAWTEIGRELICLCPVGKTTWVYANQGDPALFPDLLRNLGLPESRLIRTIHGHAGGADPWIGLQLHPPPAGSYALILSSGIGFAFHGMLLRFN